jgi:hypothetical protein
MALAAGGQYVSILVAPASVRLWEQEGLPGHIDSLHCKHFHIPHLQNLMSGVQIWLTNLGCLLIDIC